jgi:hypothetical protein
LPACGKFSPLFHEKISQRGSDDPRTLFREVSQVGSAASMAPPAKEFRRSMELRAAPSVFGREK